MTSKKQLEFENDLIRLLKKYEHIRGIDFIGEIRRYVHLKGTTSDIPLQIDGL